MRVGGAIADGEERRVLAGNSREGFASSRSQRRGHAHAAAEGDAHPLRRAMVGLGTAEKAALVGFFSSPTRACTAGFHGVRVRTVIWHSTACFGRPPLRVSVVRGDISRLDLETCGGVQRLRLIAEHAARAHEVSTPLATMIQTEVI